MLRNLYTYRRYLLGSFWVDLRYRYAGTTLGFFWFIINPLIEVAIYAVVFSQLLSIRSSAGRGVSYTIFLVTGLFPWLAFSLLISKGMNAIYLNALYLRRSLIPADIFVFKEALFALFNLFVYLILLIPVTIFMKNPLTWHVLLFPVLAVLITIFGYGIALALAHFRMLFPDLVDLFSAILQLWRWTLPIMYSDANFPALLRRIISFNPPYYFIKAFRDIFIDHSMPTYHAWLYMAFWIILSLLVGSITSRMLRSDVKDLL